MKRVRFLAAKTALAAALAGSIIVTPAQATSASSSMSPEHASSPVPPVASCSPALIRPDHTSTLVVMPGLRQSALAVTDVVAAAHRAGLEATGVARSGLPGQDGEGVLPALPFLVQNSRIVTGNDPQGRPIAGWEDTVPLPDLSCLTVTSPGSPGHPPAFGFTVCLLSAASALHPRLDAKLWCL